MTMDVAAFFMIVVGIPVIGGIGAGMFKRWIKLKEKQLDHAASLAADKAVTQAAHIERLEQRVRVLERIATDRGNELAAQIEDLRSERVN
jgi:hypothetical protein